jgi:ATP-dependent Clp protease adaptor protein ClpS
MRVERSAELFAAPAVGVAAPPDAPPARPAETPRAAVLPDADTRHMPRYRVLVHNDPITHASFVIDVLVDVFRLGRLHAVRVMLEAHLREVALVCVLPLEQAEFRIGEAHARARAQGFPLTFTAEAE